MSISGFFSVIVDLTEKSMLICFPPLVDRNFSSQKFIKYYLLFEIISFKDIQKIMTSYSFSHHHHEISTIFQLAEEMSSTQKKTIWLYWFLD